LNLLYFNIVEDPILTRDKIKLQYIIRKKPYLTGMFYEDRSDLNSLLSIVKESILMKFFGSIILLVIGLSQISNPMHKMFIPWCEGLY